MARSRTRLRGRLESLSLSEIVQTVTLGRKTGRLVLRSGKRKGRIWFEEGKVRHAETGSAHGEQAFISMVGWTAGDFVLTDGKRTDRKTLDQDAMVLVMEGLRRLDEASLAAAPCPAPKPPNRSLRLAVEIVMLLVAVAVLIVLDAARPAGVLARMGLVVQPARAAARADTGARFSEPGARAFGMPTWESQLLTAADVAGAHASYVFDALNPELYREQMLPPAEDAEIRPARDPVPEPEVVEVAEILSLELDSEHETPFWMASLPAEEEGFLAINGSSRIKSGHLTILVNDRVVYENPLLSKRKHIFRRKPEQTFEAMIPLTGGTHEVVARLRVDGKSGRYENRVTVEVEPGSTRSLSLSAGRGSNGFLSLELD